MTMLWKCNRCTTQFAVGLHMCPQCTGTDVSPVEGDEDMGKISKAQGPSIAGQPKPDPGETGEVLVGEQGPEQIVVPRETPEDTGEGDDQAPIEPTPSYTDLSKKKLIDLAKERGLAWYGNSQDIIDRLVDYDENADDDDLEVDEDD